MKIAAVQSDIAWEDPASNFERLEPQLQEAARAGSELIVLPEMFATGFSMDAQRVAEGPEGPSRAFLKEQACSLKTWICASLPWRSQPDAKPFNRLVLAGPEGQEHHYDKIHPFSFAGEHEHYDAGREFLTLTLHGVRVSFFICYDLRFADEFWGLASTTDLFVVIANWPERRVKHWSTLLRARAIENQSYVVGVNRVGVGRGARAQSIPYTGESAIIDPWGEALAQGSRDPTILYAQIDPERVHSARKTFPVLQDRR